MTNLNFRKLKLSSGREIVAGKNSEQNDLLVSSSNKEDILLHTNEPGSSFVNVGLNPTNDEIREGAVFCALKSQDFRDNKGDVIVNVFYAGDCSKGKKMKQGTWFVKKNLKTINVKKQKINKLKKEFEGLKDLENGETD